jgi:hypothetical protein
MQISNRKEWSLKNKVCLGLTGLSRLACNENKISLSSTMVLRKEKFKWTYLKRK